VLAKEQDRNGHQDEEVVAKTALGPERDEEDWNVEVGRSDHDPYPSEWLASCDECGTYEMHHHAHDVPVRDRWFADRVEESEVA
jgi:hypothetical protein